MLALPKAFKESILSLFPEEAGFFFEALQQTPLTSVRLNNKKPGATFPNAVPVEWCVNGLYLDSRPSFTFDPLFHAGAYYVQESSSMFLDAVVKSLPLPDSPLVLDLCAAPGGKSTLLLDALPDSALLVSNEVIRPRVNVLRQNLMRWGRSNVVVTQNDPAQFAKLKSSFDLIVVDAPCSGEGLWRRDPEAIREWSEDAVNLCTARQERILKDILPSLKPGGFLIYSTCTYNDAENERQMEGLQKAFGMQSFPIPYPLDWPVHTTDAFQFRFLPHRVKGEGLFIAILQKPGNTITELHSNRSTASFPLAKEWLKEPQNFSPIEENGFLYAFPRNWIWDYKNLRQSLYIRQAGICLGKPDRNGSLIPEHSLALSFDLSPAIPRYSLNLEEALVYLKKETPQVRPGTLPGWYIADFNGFSLGWMKVLPNRINNYLPAEFRILREVAS